MADPKIKYDIQAGVSGEADVQQLENSLRTLGETLEGDLKTQATGAADALQALGAKRDAVVAFRQLNNESEALVIELAETSRAVELLAQQLPQAAAATARFSAAEAAARSAVDGARQDLDEQRTALVRLREEFTGTRRRTDEYREANAQLQVTVASLRTNLREKQQALRSAEQQTASAALAEKKLGTEYSNAADAANRMRGAVLDNGRALDSARNGLTSFGIGTASLAQSERALEAAIGEVRESVRALAPAFAQASAASSSAVGKQIADQRTLKDNVRSVGDELRRIQAVATLAFTGGFIGSMIKDVTATADEFRNLEARIRLATGEGAAFDSAFRSVAEVALRTNSALSETGTLFARLAKAGRDAGLGAVDAQQQALGLTQTINQAIQLSGGSADASKAAITQLIQGLQSGVLRGEEFNSVMEQAPRLAQALAEGLGVTTGELRKMAEQGALTSSTVITALTRQSAAVASEFDKLPSTVGRSLQNLSTQWTLYVGASDNGMASSANVAKIIDGLARNLDTLVSVLYAAGKAWAAIKIAGFAADLVKWAAAASSATVAIERNTIATAANTAAHGANAAAARASAAAHASVGASAVASAGKAAAGGLVWRAASSLFGPLGIALAALGPELINVGRWLGESTARLMGHGKALEENEARLKAVDEQIRANAESRRLEAIAIEEARNRQFQLSKDAEGLIGRFEQMRQKGDSAADAIQKIGKDFDLASIKGIQDAGAVLDKLATDGKISAGQFRDAWSQALSGQDLGVFEANARAAFGGATREAERLAAMLDGTAREAIARTGLSFETLTGQVGAASRSALNDTEAIVQSLDRLEKQGVDVGLALSASLGKSINTADSEKALEALRGQIEAVRVRLGDKVADGLLQQAAAKAEELRASLDRLKPGIQSVTEAFEHFGLKSAEALQRTASTSREAYDALRTSGKASADQLREAFMRTAADAIAANNGIAPSWLTVEAALRGVTLKTDEFGKATVETLRKTGDAWRAYGDTVRSEAAAASALSAPPDRTSTTGSTRDQRLAGQNAVDASLQFILRDKLAAGTLEESDVGSLRAVVAALRSNAQTNDDARRLGGGTFLSNEGYRDAMAWQQTRRKFEDAIEQLEGRGGVSTGASTSHTVTLKFNGKSVKTSVASAEDARDLVGTLTQISKSTS